jgi:transposase
MGKRFRTCDLNEPFLLPPSLQDWLPEGHLARLVAEMAEQLDLSAIYASHERRDGRGKAAYHPLRMTRLLLYAYCVGKPSSRAIAPRSELAERMRVRLRDPAEKALYAMRKAIVEPVFAQIKERRGFRRFSLRGLRQVRAEWALICRTHNLLKLPRHRIEQAAA